MFGIVIVHCSKHSRKSTIYKSDEIRWKFQVKNKYGICDYITCTNVIKEKHSAPDLGRPELPLEW